MAALRNAFAFNSGGNKQMRGGRDYVICKVLPISALQEGLKMALEKELETYRHKLPELKDQEGKFVLIKGSEVVDTYTSYEDALKEGYTRYGPDTPFLVKQIQVIEQVHFISRFAQPCHISQSR